VLRKFVLGTSSWMLLAAAASAADLPVAVSAPPVVVSSWAGFYLGAHGGYGWGKNDFFQVAIPTTFDGIGNIKSRGGVYGGHAGYNWQYGRAVTGLEIDFSATDLEGGTRVAGVLPQQGLLTFDRTDRLKYLGTARARLGWLPADNVLLYGTAGAAWERYDQLLNIAVGPPTNFAQVAKQPSDQFGWVAGVGAEAMLPGSNWVGRVEYLHYDFGSVNRFQSTTSTVPNSSFSDRSGSQTYDIVRAGLSYKFGSRVSANQPVYAKAPVLAAASSWAGFYLGVHGGYGWGDNKYSMPLSLAPAVSIWGPHSAGGVVGGHAGYNWQYDRAVAGLELDFSGTDIRGTSQSVFATPAGGGVLASNTTYSLTDKTTYLGSVRARIGWLPLESVLLYGTAGLGWKRLDRNTVNTDTNASGTATFKNESSIDTFGWVAGVGAETRISGSNWLARLEYLHYDFATSEVSGTVVAPNGTFTQAAGHHGVDIVRAGVSYKFGEQQAAAPVRYAKAPAIAPAAATWAGFYLGGHGGYAWKDDDFTQTVLGPITTGGIKASGWVAGWHGGYNWQYGRIVAGLETDFSFSDLRGNSAPVVRVAGGTTETIVLSDRVKNLATARARLGWLPSDTVLLYATGGLAWERLERTNTDAQVAANFAQTDVFRTTTDRFGGVIGGGAEWMPWGPNWIGRLEYLHYDFGQFRDATVFTSNRAGDVPFAERRGRQTIELVRAGISYKFSADQPIVARY